MKHAKRGRWEYIGYVDYFSLSLPKSERTRVVKRDGRLVRQVWRPAKRRVR